MSAVSCDFGILMGGGELKLFYSAILSSLPSIYIFLNNRLSLVTGYRKIIAAYELVNMVNIIDNIVSSHWVK